jgi:uncharacterized protein Usg
MLGAVIGKEEWEKTMTHIIGFTDAREYFILPDPLMTLNGVGCVLLRVTYPRRNLRGEQTRILQEYVWWYDGEAFPAFPKLFRFLDHWLKHIHSPPVAVDVDARELVTGREIRHAVMEGRIH